MPTKALRRGGAIGATAFAIGFLANLLVFTRNFDTAQEVSQYLDDSKLLNFLRAIAVRCRATWVSLALDPRQSQ